MTGQAAVESTSPMTTEDAAITTDAEVLLAHTTPKEYLERFYQNGVRPDARSFEAMRKLRGGSADLKNCYGSSLVCLGGTKIICGVLLERQYRVFSLVS